MKSKLTVSIILFCVVFLSGCGQQALSNNETELTTRTNGKANKDEIGIQNTVGDFGLADDSNNYEVFNIEDIKDNDYFENYLKNAKTITPSEIIADNVDHAVYSFFSKNQEPEIDWYDCNDLEIEHLSNYGSTTRYIHTTEYENDSLPSVNSYGDALEYLEPYSEHNGCCMYDDNGRIVTEFSNNENDSPEVFQYNYNSKGQLSRKTHIEIDYYNIDWGDMADGSEFSEDDAFESVIHSVHLDYYYDEYIYDSDNLLVRIDTYQAGDKEPFLYEMFEYDNKNRISKSYSGYYNEETINSIQYYEYY